MLALANSTTFMNKDNQYRKMDNALKILIWISSVALILYTLDVLMFDNALVRSVLGYEQ